MAYSALEPEAEEGAKEFFNRLAVHPKFGEYVFHALGCISLVLYERGCLGEPNVYIIKATSWVRRERKGNR